MMVTILKWGIMDDDVLSSKMLHERQENYFLFFILFYMYRSLAMLHVWGCHYLVYDANNFKKTP